MGHNPYDDTEKLQAKADANYMQIVDKEGNPVHDQPETTLTVAPAPDIPRPVHPSAQTTTQVKLPALKDGGSRKTYSTGAQKEDDSKTEGKGAYHLLPQHPIRRVSEIYRKGAMKYSARNWEKGIPLSRSLDSAERHLAQFHEGMEDEDHLHQAIWNLFAISHTMEMIRRGRLPAELNDLPSYGPVDEKGQMEFGWREPGDGCEE